jgi:hypothetical protein
MGAETIRLFEADVKNAMDELDASKWETVRCSLKGASDQAPVV